MSNEHRPSAPAAPAEPSEPSAAPSGKPICKGAASLSGDLITSGRKDARRTLAGQPPAGAASRSTDSRSARAPAPASAPGKPETPSTPAPEVKSEPAPARPEPAEIVRESLAAMRERESAAPEKASRWRMFIRPTGKEIRLILVVYAVFLAGFLALVWL